MAPPPDWRDLQAVARSEDDAAKVAVILRLARESRLTERLLYLFLGDLFTSRQIGPLEALLANEAVGFPDIRLYHRIRLDHYRGIAPIPEDALRAFIGRAQESSVLRSAAMALAAEQAVRTENLPLTLYLLGETSAEALRAIPPGCRVGGLRLLIKHGWQTEAVRLLDRFLAGLDEEARLYFLEVGQMLLPGEGLSRFGLPESAGWRQVLEKQRALYSAADEADRETFDRLVPGTLSRVPEGERDLMDVRFSAEQRRRLLRLIADRLSEGRPLSLVRLGDGEAYAFDAPPMPHINPVLFDEDNLVRERHWWSDVLPADRRQAIKAAVRDAVLASDIIGIPSVYRIIRDRGPPRLRFGQSRGHRGLAVVLNAVAESVDLARCIATEERCHQVVFGRAEIEELAATARRTVVVGCWARDQIDMNFGKCVSFIAVPPAVKVKQNAGALPARAESLPYQIDAVADEVGRQSAPGTLVLVAAGLLGKIMIHRAQMAGAVALDVGSIFDYSAGFKTRNITDVV